MRTLASWPMPGPGRALAPSTTCANVMQSNVSVPVDGRDSASLVGVHQRRLATVRLHVLAEMYVATNFR